MKWDKIQKRMEEAFDSDQYQKKEYTPFEDKRVTVLLANSKNEINELNPNILPIGVNIVVIATVADIKPDFEIEEIVFSPNFNQNPEKLDILKEMAQYIV